MVERSGFRADTMRAVCEKAGISEKALRSKRKFRNLVVKRWYVMAQLRALGWSTTAIGIACNRDHSSVSVALQRWEARNMAAQVR